jgi:hypothetical protein
MNRELLFEQVLKMSVVDLHLLISKSTMPVELIRVLEMGVEALENKIPNPKRPTLDTFTE